MTRPICDTCSARHSLLGTDGQYLVTCEIKGQRWAPMADGACDAHRQYIWPVAKAVKEGES